MLTVTTIELTFLIPQGANLESIKEKILGKMSTINYLHNNKPAEFYYTIPDGVNVRGVLSVWIHNHHPPGYLQTRNDVLVLATNALKESGIIT